MGINHAIAKGDRIWAAGGGGWYPPGVWRRIGGEWHLSGEGFEAGVQSVWSLAVDGDRLLAGTKTAALYASYDDGASWQKLPAHRQDPGTVWTFPLNGDSEGPFPPGASAAVWRSRDGGESWQYMREGLPASNCFFTVLRQAMAVGPQAEVYFGTNTGSVYASTDEGDTWAEIARHLPTVLCVEVES